MSQTSVVVQLNETPLTAPRYPKRKRAVVSYAEDELDADNSDCTDDGDEYSTQRKTKAKRISKARKHNQKPFPFLLLPAELRNRIYDLTLVDPEGIHIRSFQGRYRRKAVHCAPAECVPQYGRSNFWNSQLKSQDELSKVRCPLNAALLATCKTIYEEATPVLYSQRITISDTYAMQAFLMQLGSRGAGRLTDLRVAAWCTSRSHKAINLPAFAQLRDATSLQRMKIDCRLGFYRSYWRWDDERQNSYRPLHIAQQLYRSCFPWLESIQHGAMAIDKILEISDQNYRPSGRSWDEKEDDQDYESRMRGMHEAMLVELHRLLDKRV